VGQAGARPPRGGSRLGLSVQRQGNVSADSEPLLYAKHDGWAEIQLNRPERHNALSAELLDRLLGGVEDAVSDAGVRVLLLTAAGRSFCVGGDMAAFGDGVIHDGDAAGQVGELRRQMRVTELLCSSDLVSVAAINGACAGAGLSIAAACDLRVGSERALFRTGFLDAGLSGDFGGTWLLSRLVGQARARELYLLNRKVDAQAALQLGLVSEILAEDELRPRAERLAADLAAKSPIALSCMKQNLADAEGTLGRSWDREAERHIRCGRTDDAVEAANAWLEKRPPRFAGR
jgi:2-(1,2-epoxy-1,2-dihydrophenyl)acetyl-CoA isomerase